MVYHWLQDVRTLEESVGPIPVEPGKVCYIDFRIVPLSRDAENEFLDAFENEYPLFLGYWPSLTFGFRIWTTNRLRLVNAQTALHLSVPRVGLPHD